MAICDAERPACKLAAMAHGRRVIKKPAIAALPSRRRGGARGARGQRLCLSTTQFGALFRTLVEENCAWVAALALLQVCMGERGACACAARRGWLKHIDRHDPEHPTIDIPRVNRKTVKREIPFNITIAAMFHTWLTESPLAGTWHAEDQHLGATDCLFPGMKPGGRNERLAHKPITRQSFSQKLRQIAVPALRAQVAEAQRFGQAHPFEGEDLSRLGTHSFKSTGVALLKDKVFSTALVSEITGTSIETLHRYYIAPWD